MTDKIFIDTNILVYAHDTSAGSRHDQAKKLITDLWNNGIGNLSIQVLQEFYVNVTQKVANPISPQRAKEIVRDLSYWDIHQPVPNDVTSAIDLQQRYRTSFWDAMIIQSALQLHCTQIWSEDLNSGQYYDSIVVVNPFTPQSSAP